MTATFLGKDKSSEKKILLRQLYCLQIQQSCALCPGQMNVQDIIRSTWNTKPGEQPGFVVAEGVGFEPTVARVDHNGFRDRPNRPLWHPSLMKRIIPSGSWGVNAED